MYGSGDYEVEFMVGDEGDMSEEKVRVLDIKVVKGDW